jgi:hypothetical protein
MIKQKEFKCPTSDPVRVLSHDGNIISWVYPEWTTIREELWRDAYSKGCISKDMSMIGADPFQAAAVEEAKEKAFEAQVKETMARLIEEGDPEDLDAKGRPKVDVIGDIVGSVPTAYMRNRLFVELTGSK